ncbi:hypothetical protein Q7P37_007491 [Cladosporium fusiforme]
MRAFAHARVGPDHTSPFEDDEVVETGYVWENHIFGGTDTRLITPGQDSTTDFAILEWPATCVVRRYLTDGDPISISQCFILSDIDASWCIAETAWFESLFTNAFWAETVPTKGESALKAPKEKGWRWIVSSECMLKLWDPEEHYGMYKFPTPKGFVEGELGRLFPSKNRNHKHVA